MTTLYNHEAQMECKRRRPGRQKTTKEVGPVQKDLWRECGCCFTEDTVLKMACCSAIKPHFFCWDCIKKQIELEFGKANYWPKCVDISLCRAEIPEEILSLALGLKTFERLKHKRNQEEIKATHQSHELDICSFCGYAEIRSSNIILQTFSCNDEDCGHITCRLCKLPDHSPFTCIQIQQFYQPDLTKKSQQQQKQDSLHAVEEAMSMALMRHCNECKTPFVKEGNDCNKITCVKCKNKQCYNCGENVSSYDHFGVDRCQLFDITSTSSRHYDEIQRARDQAVYKVRTERPEIRTQDIYVTVIESERTSAVDASERIKQNFAGGVDIFQARVTAIPDMTTMPEKSAYIPSSNHIPAWCQEPGLYQSNKVSEWSQIQGTSSPGSYSWSSSAAEATGCFGPTPLLTALITAGLQSTPELPWTEKTLKCVEVASPQVNKRLDVELPPNLQPRIWN